MALTHSRKMAGEGTPPHDTVTGSGRPQGQTGNRQGLKSPQGHSLITKDSGQNASRGTSHQPPHRQAPRGRRAARSSGERSAAHTRVLGESTRLRQAQAGPGPVSPGRTPVQQAHQKVRGQPGRGRGCGPACGSVSTLTQDTASASSAPNAQHSSARTPSASTERQLQRSSTPPGPPPAPHHGPGGRRRGGLLPPLLRASVPKRCVWTAAEPEPAPPLGLQSRCIL